MKIDYEKVLNTFIKEYNRKLKKSKVFINIKENVMFWQLSPKEELKATLPKNVQSQSTNNLVLNQQRWYEIIYTLRKKHVKLLFQVYESQFWKFIKFWVR